MTDVWYLFVCITLRDGKLQTGKFITEFTTASPAFDQFECLGTNLYWYQHSDRKTKNTSLGTTKCTEF